MDPSSTLVVVALGNRKDPQDGPRKRPFLFNGARETHMANYEQYREHMDRYASQTMHLSMTRVDHPDFQELARSGREIVPYLLRDIQDQRGDFWAAVRLLWNTLEDAPVLPEDDRGRYDKIRNLWIKWGREHGYLSSG